MHSKTIALALFAASGALAAPHSRRSYDNTVRVILSDLGETGAQVVLDSESRNSATPALSGPFLTVEVDLGADVQNTALRCQVLDNYGNPITATRGANIDTTFSDADKGPWTFVEPSLVSEVVCDPSFKAVPPPAATPDLTVILQSQSTETGSQTQLTSGSRQTASPIGSSGPFETVELSVDATVADQAYRCQILDNYGQPLIVLRGANRDITFSDADKGAWTLETPSEVSQIVCDPTFVAMKV